MTMNIEALQELAPSEAISLDACPILGSCCQIQPWVPLFTIVSCFGCSFTN